jgi:hypothetical protein
VLYILYNILYIKETNKRGETERGGERSIEPVR